MRKYSELETERLFLRPTAIDDAEFFFELLNTPKWIQYIGERHITDMESAKKYIQEKVLPKPDKVGVNFTVRLKENGAKIGSCGLYRREGLDYMDIGFAFLPGFEQQGYAYESARRVLEMGFSDFGIDRVCAITTEDNFRSQRLLTKLGMEYEKIIRIPNDDVDLMLYNLDAADWNM
ncbi:MAG TPA: N-acetyltransferase [Saprospiraceae bacterium]|nr:N-acetyltransferase [Saprospiraceae bacterium]